MPLNYCYFTVNYVMRSTLFLSRVAILFNVFLVVAWLSIWFMPQAARNASGSFFFIFFLFTIITNPLVNLIYLFLLLRKRLFVSIPTWIVLVNFVFLLVELLYILFLNGKLPS